MKYGPVGIEEARAIYAARMSGVEPEPQRVVGPSDALIGDNLRDGVILCDHGRPISTLQLSSANADEEEALAARFRQAVRDYKARSRGVL